MAYRKKLATPRQCVQCGDPYEAVDRRRLYCCPACKTAASQARRAATPTKTRPATATSTANGEVATPVAAGEAGLAALPATPPNPSFGKLVLATTAGNLLTDVIKHLWAPKAATGRAPASGWPTWPPAELLTATGPPVQLTDPSWTTPQLLTPATYRQHQFYLCVEEELTVVLYRVRAGEWRYVQTPAELARVVAQPPISGLRALIAEHVPTFDQEVAAPHAALLAPSVAPDSAPGR